MGSFGYAATAALVAVLLTSCGGGPSGAGRPTVDLSGGWYFSSGSTDEGELTTEPRRVTLGFEGRVGGGYAGCNFYGSRFELTGDDLTFDGFDGFDKTLMDCDDGLALESAFLAALGDVRRVQRDGSRLTLSGEDVSLEFVSMPPFPKRAVLDRTWQLARIPSQPRPAGDPATLRLRRDGSITATSGCRTLTGTWDEWQGDIIAAELSMRGNCPARFLKQDGLVGQTLSRFSGTINTRGELVLTARQGDIHGQPLLLIYRRQVDQ